MIVSTKQSKQYWGLTDEAEEVLKIGSPGIIIRSIYSYNRAKNI